MDREQGVGQSQSNIRLWFAAQAAYLLMNTLVFHKIPEDLGPTIFRPPPSSSPPRTVQADLWTPFLRIVNYDFELSYEHDPIFDKGLVPTWLLRPQLRSWTS